jgi:glycosyltransferase involved in cell wall biosynthesis
VTVLYLIDELCGLGGAEKALLRIVRHLPRERFRPLVATFRSDPSFPADAFCAPLYVLPLRRTYDWQAVRAACSLRRLIRDARVRIAHCFFETADLWGGAVAKWSGCPVLISSRRDMGILSNWKHRLAYRAMGRMFDQVQTVSEKVRRLTITRDHLPEGRVVTVYTGVDLEGGRPDKRRAELRRELGLPVSSPLVITVANLRPVKGIEIFLRAAALVCRKRPDATFVIVGAASDPGYFEEMQRLSTWLGISDHVRFWGPEGQPAKLLSSSDIFALLSNNEGFSNAIVEAMAQQLPCVVTDVGGNAEAVRDGHNGWLVPRADYSAAADRILALVEDVELRRRMGAAGFEVVERQFTTPAMIERLTGCYEALLH